MIEIKVNKPSYDEHINFLKQRIEDRITTILKAGKITKKTNLIFQ